MQERSDGEHFVVWAGTWRKVLARCSVRYSFW